MTPDDLERQAAEAEARADKLKALAELEYEHARWLRDRAAKVRRIEGGLSRGAEYGTRDSMTPAVHARVVASALSRRGGAELHPFQKWLHKRKRSPRNVGEAAKAIGIPESRARSWTKTKDGQRPIWESDAKAIESRWGYEVSAANWPNGIAIGK